MHVRFFSEKQCSSCNNAKTNIRGPVTPDPQNDVPGQAVHCRLSWLLWVERSVVTESALSIIVVTSCYDVRVL